MKLLFRCLLLAMSFSLVSSCSGDNEVTYSSADFNKFIATDFLKTWRYDKIEVNGQENRDVIPCWEQMRVTFKGDNTFSQWYEKGAQCPAAFTGTWKFDATTNQLTIVKPAETTTANLVSASTSKFTLEVNNGESKISLNFIRVDEKK